MSPALTKKRIWCDDRKKKKKKRKEEKEEKEETRPRAELEASMRKEVLNESELQEARRCKGSGKWYGIMSEVGWWVLSYEHL